MHLKSTTGLFLFLFAALLANKGIAQTPGSLDTQFGTGGIVQVPFGNNFSECRTIAVQPDGKVILGGTYLSGGLVTMAFTRLNTNGTIDNTFGTAGKAVVPFDNDKASLAAIRVLANGKIIAAGGSNNKPAILRLTAAGVPDNTFGTNGVVTFDANMTAILDMYELPNGKLVGCAPADQGSGKLFAAFRRNADGTVDNTFGTSGYAYANVGQLPNLTKMAVQPDGKLLLTGTVYNASTPLYDLILFRFNADGTPDNTFDSDGKLVTTLSTNNQAYEQGNAIAVQLDGKIVVAGRITNAGPTVFAIVRFMANGAKDTGFGTSGVATINFNNNNDEPKAIAIQKDGKIVVVGSTLLANNTNREITVARLTKTGALDNAFDTDGKVTTAIGTKAWGEALALQSDGKIVVSGYADISNLRQYVAARYNVGTIVGTSEPESGISSIQVFPNPAKPGSSFTLQLDLEKTQDCRIQLLGADGRLLRTYPAQTLPAGQQELKFELPAGLSAGLVWLRLETESGAATRTLILID